MISDNGEDRWAFATVTVAPGPKLALGNLVGTNFTPEEILVAAPSLSAYGTTILTVDIVDINDNNSAPTWPVTVSFSSACDDSDTAYFSNNEVVTLSGVAQTTYHSDGCVGDDIITATLNDKGEQRIARATVINQPASVNSLSFNDFLITPRITYKNTATGTLTNNINVSFTVTDALGRGIFGQTVTFEIYADAGNHGATLSVSEALSDTNGTVSTNVTAGYLAANLRVTASYTDALTSTVISTQSAPIAVNTGYADADSFLMVTDNALVKGAADSPYEETTINIQLADKNNHPVADGTVVSFWAEHGRIEPQCTTNESGCTVTWTSSGAPADYLTTVLAYTTGVDSFVEITPVAAVGDVGADGRYSIEDLIFSHSEVFYDRNFDGIHDRNLESYIDHNSNGKFDLAGSLNYRGVDCDDTAIAAGHCTETSAQIWDQIQLGYSSDFPDTPIAIPASPWVVGSTNQVQVADINGLFPLVGTKLNITNLGLTDAGLVVLNSVPKIGNAIAAPFEFDIIVNSVTTPGFVEIQVEFPSGETSSLIIEVQ